MQIILCIDDEPIRYRHLIKAALEEDIVVLITEEVNAIEQYLHHYKGMIIGICLDHDMHWQNGLMIANDHLIDRNIPVAIVSLNSIEARNISDLLREHNTPCTEHPIDVDEEWADTVVCWFLRNSTIEKNNNKDN